MGIVRRFLFLVNGGQVRNQCLTTEQCLISNKRTMHHWKLSHSYVKEPAVTKCMLTLTGLLRGGQLHSPMLDTLADRNFWCFWVLMFFVTWAGTSTGCVAMGSSQP